MTIVRERPGWRMVVCLAAAGLLVTSCSSGQSGEARSSGLPPAGAQQGQPPAQRAVTIRVLAPESRSLTAVEQLKIDHESRTGVSVEITSRASMQRVLTEVDEELAAGRGTYDLVLVPHRALGRLVESGYVRSLNASVGKEASPDTARFDPERDLFDQWWRATSWYRGKPYGYPFIARAMSLWYRSDLSDEEEADAFYTKYRHPMTASSTWDEYAHIAEFMHRPETGRYGATVVGAPEEALADVWTQFAYSFGAAVMDAAGPDEYGDIVVNSPEALRATEFYVKLLRLSPPDAAGYTELAALRAFQEGRAATGVMWHNLSPRVDDSRESKFSGRYGYARIPTAGGKRATLVASDLFLIPESAPHPREAFEFMQWALTHQVQLSHTLQGGFSARPSVYEDRTPRGTRRLHMWMFPHLIEGAVPTMMIPEAEEIARVMSAELSEVVRGTVTPRAGLDRLARRVEQTLTGKVKLRYRPQ